MAVLGEIKDLILELGEIHTKVTRKVSGVNTYHFKNLEKLSHSCKDISKLPTIKLEMLQLEQVSFLIIHLHKHIVNSLLEDIYHNIQ